MPLFISGLFIGSAFDEAFGWTACALSAETIMLEATSFAISETLFPKASPILLIVSLRKVDPAPCLVSLPTSSLSKAASIGIESLLSAAKSACRAE